jgi:acetoin utilization protein AcuB
MSKGIPQVSKYMTAMPKAIEPHQTLETARSWMDEMRVRHLAVRSAKKVIGIISDRDISLVAGFKDADLSKVAVSDAMTNDPYCVPPETPLDVVCSNMAEHRYGSTLVVQENGTLVGIFTYTDALKVLAEIFTTRLKK